MSMAADHAPLIPVDEEYPPLDPADEQHYRKLRRPQVLRLLRAYMQKLMRLNMSMTAVQTAMLAFEEGSIVAVLSNLLLYSAEDKFGSPQLFRFLCDAVPNLIAKINAEKRTIAAKRRKANDCTTAPLSVHSAFQKDALLLIQYATSDWASSRTLALVANVSLTYLLTGQATHHAVLKEMMRLDSIWVLHTENEWKLECSRVMGEFVFCGWYVSIDSHVVRM